MVVKSKKRTKKEEKPNRKKENSVRNDHIYAEQISASMFTGNARQVDHEKEQSKREEMLNHLLSDKNRNEYLNRALARKHGGIFTPNDISNYVEIERVG